MLFTDVIPAILVTKTADQPSVDETGELVTFTVTVENDTLEPVTVDSLVDDVYGDLTTLADSTCVAGAELEPDDGVAGSGDRHVHVRVHGARRPARHRAAAQGHGHRDRSRQRRELARVRVTTRSSRSTSIPPTVDLTKQDQPDGNATVDEPGGDVPYTITMTNTSDEPVTITTLTDTATYESPAGETDYNLLSPAQPISDVECSRTSDAIAPIRPCRARSSRPCRAMPRSCVTESTWSSPTTTVRSAAIVAAAQVPIWTCVPRSRS